MSIKIPRDVWNMIVQYARPDITKYITYNVTYNTSTSTSYQRCIKTLKFKTIDLFEGPFGDPNNYLVLSNSNSSHNIYKHNNPKLYQTLIDHMNYYKIDK